MNLLASLAFVALQSLLRVAFVGDPQADGSGQVVYNQRSIFKELRTRKDLDLVIVLGDIVNDDVKLLDPSIASLDSLSVPWFAIPGNHDRDIVPGVPRDLKTWRERVGYVDTSFVAKGVRFVLMNMSAQKASGTMKADSARHRNHGLTRWSKSRPKPNASCWPHIFPCRK